MQIRYPVISGGKSGRLTLLICVVAASAQVTLVPLAAAQSRVEQTEHGGVHPAASAVEPPVAPRDGPDVRRSTAEYAIPNVRLTRDDGVSVSLQTEINDGRPVVLNFVYTSCTTICPMSSQVFEQFQADLGARSAAVHLLSISIDPEQDTPARLRAYAKQFHASKSWNHYSGSMASILQVQRAFNAYRGDKMSHVPLTLLRSAPGTPWVRFDGFAGADELLAESSAWAAPALAVR